MSSTSKEPNDPDTQNDHSYFGIRELSIVAFDVYNIINFHLNLNQFEKT